MNDALRMFQAPTMGGPPPPSYQPAPQAQTLSQALTAAQGQTEQQQMPAYPIGGTHQAPLGAPTGMGMVPPGPIQQQGSMGSTMSSLLAALRGGQ